MLNKNSLYWIVLRVMAPAGLFFFMISFSTGCKKPASKPDEETGSKLNSLVDYKYILLMRSTVPDGRTENKVTGEYEFITCRISRRLEGDTGAWEAQQHQQRMTNPDRLMSDNLGGGLGRGFVGSFRGNIAPSPVGYDPLISFLPYDWSRTFRIISSSCTPTFTDDQGKSFIVVPHKISEYQLYAARDHIATARDIEDREKGVHYIAGFGFGSLFNSFTGVMRKAIMSVLPQGLPAFGRHLLTFVAQFSFMSKAQPADYNFVEKVMGNNNDPHYAIVLPKGIDINDRPWELSAPESAGAVAAAGAGYATTHIIIKITSQAGTWGGPWGVILGNTVVPFATTMIIATRENVGKDILDNFNQLLLSHNPESMTDMKSHSSEHVGRRVQSIPEISRLFGETLLLSRWVPAELLKKYCYPGESIGSEPQCKKIELAYSLPTIKPPQLGVTATASAARQSAEGTGSPDTPVPPAE